MPKPNGPISSGGAATRRQRRLEYRLNAVLLSRSVGPGGLEHRPQCLPPLRLYRRREDIQGIPRLVPTCRRPSWSSICRASRWSVFSCSNSRLLKNVPGRRDGNVILSAIGFGESRRMRGGDERVHMGHLANGCRTERHTGFEPGKHFRLGHSKDSMCSRTDAYERPNPSKTGDLPRMLTEKDDRGTRRHEVANNLGQRYL